MVLPPFGPTCTPHGRMENVADTVCGNHFDLVYICMPNMSRMILSKVILPSIRLPSLHTTIHGKIVIGRIIWSRFVKDQKMNMVIQGKGKVNQGKFNLDMYEFPTN